MKVAVLLTCHNRKSKTVASLQSVHNADKVGGIECIVFLVDDASTDGTSDAISQLFPEVVIIKGNGNLYWNRGMHLAWSKALEWGNFDYFLWLNDDTFLLSSGWQEMFEAARAYDDQAVICGAIVDPDFKTQTYGGSKLDKSGQGLLLEPNGNWQECDLMHGNCVLVPSSIVERVGIIDPAFRHAIGDFDYGLRVKKAGYHLITTRAFVATCAANNSLPKWCLHQTPLLERVRSLYSPLGNSEPIPYFIYTKRHFGYWYAVRNLISIHIRMIFPKLWLK